MLKMVVGFLFCNDSVLLVQKKSPEWQRGFWNGVGGKCNENEPFRSTMIREFYEETGIATTASSWTRFCEESGPPEYHAVFFKMHWTTPDLPNTPVQNDVGEPLRWVPVQALPKYEVIGNLRWLMPLAADWRQHTPVIVSMVDDIREKATW